MGNKTKTKAILLIVAILIVLTFFEKRESFANLDPANVQIIILCKKVNQQLYDVYSSLFVGKKLIFISDENPEIKKRNIYHYKDDPEFYGMHSKIKHTSWDKAFFHLSKNNEHDYYWFIEDDVYISTKNVIDKFDRKYTEDFLMFAWHNFDRFTKSKINKFWFDSHIKHTLKNVEYFPVKYLSGSLNVFTRLSKKHVDLILNFRKKHKRFIFHEMLIPSIARQNDLKIKKIDSSESNSVMSPREIFKEHKTINDKIQHFKNKKLELAHPAKQWYKQ